MYSTAGQFKVYFFVVFLNTLLCLMEKKCCFEVGRIKRILGLQYSLCIFQVIHYPGAMLSPTC